MSLIKAIKSALNAVYKGLRSLFPFCHCHAIQTEEDLETPGPPEPRPWLHQENTASTQEATGMLEASPQDELHKCHPGHSGKVGVRHDHLKRNQSFCPTVNLDKLWMLVSEQTWFNAAKTKPGAAPITDVV
jgi:hypothetical protein